MLRNWSILSSEFTSLKRYPKSSKWSTIYHVRQGPFCWRPGVQRPGNQLSAPILENAKVLAREHKTKIEMSCHREQEMRQTIIRIADAIISYSQCLENAQALGDYLQYQRYKQLAPLNWIWVSWMLQVSLPKRWRSNEKPETPGRSQST